jgi:hypothetical protein
MIRDPEDQQDPESVRLNIQHYEKLLKLHGTKRTKDQVQRLLAQAQARLSVSKSRASKRTR